MLIDTFSAFLLAGADPLDHVVPHRLFGSDWFTSLHLMGVVTAAVTLLLFVYVAFRVQVSGADVESHVTKGRLAQVFEVICEYIRDHVAKPNLGHLTDKYIYYVWSVFFFVLIANLLGMIPFGSIAALAAHYTGNDAHAAQHFGGTITANLMVTGSLAFLSFLMIVGVGVREQGAKYFAHFAPVPFEKNPVHPMNALALFLVVLEIMGLFIKCIVLAVRLFGNLMAGHLVIAAVMGMILTVTGITQYILGGAVVFSLTILSLLELFVAFLQAFIFTFLTVLFIAAGAVHHGDHHEHDEQTPIGVG